MTILEVWYASIDIEKMISGIEDSETRRRGLRRLAASRASSMSERHFPTVVIRAGQSPTIQDNPPLIQHPRNRGEDSIDVLVRESFADYRKSLSDDRRALFDRFDLADAALKVVGVGSVGTWCSAMLMTAGGKDHLFLQMKEAGPSVLEAYVGKSIFPNHGQRVVNGCRLMQSASDIFLGWLKTRHGRHFYVRKLRDVKIGAPIEQLDRARWSSTLSFAAGRWRERMRAPAHRRRLADTLATATPSIRPSRPSPGLTPIKANATTPPSRRRCGRGA